MFIYMIILVCFQVVIIKCTIDISIDEFIYIGNHLTPQECRRLFAALHFTSYDLPTALSAAENLVPQDTPCIELLLLWDSGLEKWQGKDKTHVDVTRRLQQLGRLDLANWLGRNVFHNLAKDVCNALDNSFNDDYEEITKNKLYEDKCNSVSDEWTDLDYILWLLLIGLILTVILTFGNIIVIRFKKKTVDEKKDEDEIDLLSRVSIDLDTRCKCISTRQDLVNRNKEGIN